MKIEARAYRCADPLRRRQVVLTAAEVKELEGLGVSSDVYKIE